MSPSGKISETDGLVREVRPAEDIYYEHPENVQQTTWLNGRKVVVLGP